MPAGGRDSHFEGRRFAVLMRDLDAPVGADPVAALRGWLEEGRRGASRALAAKASCWCSRVVCAAGSCGRGAEVEARCDARQALPLCLHGCKLSDLLVISLFSGACGLELGSRG
jgi:hypothetical protein